MSFINLGDDDSGESDWDSGNMFSRKDRDGFSDSLNLFYRKDEDCKDQNNKKDKNNESIRKIAESHFCKRS